MPTGNASCPQPSLLEVSTDGHVIVISPVRKGRRAGRVKALVAEAHQRYSGVFRRLAE